MGEPGVARCGEIVIPVHVIDLGSVACSDGCRIVGRTRIYNHNLIRSTGQAVQALGKKCSFIADDEMYT
ncbi:hypothetical protein D3C73_910520 [compost metagenome]